MANLIVCCDGTWNTPDETDGGLPAPTNVVKIFNALAKTDAAGTPQKSYYHPGVGTDGTWWSKLAGGSTGQGLDRNIMSSYRWLAGQYQPGDRIYLFGFSRGAYTVRSLGGMISRCGLLDASSVGPGDAELWSTVQYIFNAYRDRRQLLAARDMKFHGAMVGQVTAGTTPIAFVGVWDTVGSLGIPDDLGVLQLLDNPERYQFHDTSLSPIVQCARHALAIDERRESFSPTLWTQIADSSDVQQIWFPGVHCDVGGGYLSSGLSDGALQWMIDESCQAGVSFRSSIAAFMRPDPSGPIHDSVAGVFRSFKTAPRQVPALSGLDAKSRFHSSALQRYENPPLDQKDYWSTQVVAPGETAEFDVFAQQRWNRTGLYLEAGGEYRFEAAGEWLDSSISCGPGGTDDGKFQLGELVQMASSVLGKSEILYKRLGGNPQTDFWWTRREENFPWFALVGVVGNGDGVDGANGLQSHQSFLIGAATTFQPTVGGYLYCFANDAWQAYGNNRGSVSVRLTRLS